MFEFVSRFPLLSILLVVGFFIGLSAWKQMHPKYHRLCLKCGKTGVPTRKVAGSGLIEIILWLLFLVPPHVWGFAGVIYSIWRRNAAKRVCDSCGGTDLVPVDSPTAIASLSPATPPAIAEPAPVTPPTASEETKRCPMCAEVVLAAAVKCKHCGSAI